MQEFLPGAHHDTYPFISPTTFSLRSKHIFITGASKGIGRALALSCARAGATALALAARSPLATLTTELVAAAKAGNHPPPKVFVYQMDILSRADIEATAAQAARDLDGRVDVLVNNAGYLESPKKVADSDPDEVWRTWEVNYRGLYLVTRAFLPVMLRGGDKQIVNVSSAGAHITREGMSGYQTSKFAMCRFTEFLMVEYGAQGVVSMAVHPGGVMTELAKGMDQEMHVFLVDTVDLGADTMAWLISERREWLGGRYVSVNWDMEKLVERKDEVIKGDLLKFRMVGGW